MRKNHRPCPFRFDLAGRFDRTIRIYFFSAGGHRTNDSHHRKFALDGPPNELTCLLFDIKVTVESDRKQMVTRLSPVPSQTSPVLPIVAPKPFGKATAEYHPVRRPGNGSETVRAADSNEKRSTSIEANARASNSSGSSHETLMESIRRFGGSHNLGRK